MVVVVVGGGGGGTYNRKHSVGHATYNILKYGFVEAWVATCRYIARYSDHHSPDDSAQIGTEILGFLLNNIVGLEITYEVYEF